MKSAMGLDLGVMIKREVLNGPFGPIVRRLGMVPIDRKAATDVVGQMVERFATRDKMWLGIAPEGTRKPFPTGALLRRIKLTKTAPCICRVYTSHSVGERRCSRTVV